MTILNVWTGSVSTLIAVDTLTIEAGGVASGHASKLQVMPAARSVFAWRGLMGFGMQLAPSAMWVAGSLDDLEAVLPDWLPCAVDGPAAAAIHPGRGIDLIASGWSDKRGRLATIVWVYRDANWREMGELGSQMALTCEMFPSDFDPAPQLVNEARRIGQVPAMHQLLHRQVSAWRLEPQTAERRELFDCGGCGIVAHLTADTEGRTTISVHNVGSIEPPV